VNPDASGLENPRYENSVCRQSHQTCRTRFRNLRIRFSRRYYGTMRFQNRGRIILALFFFSGATALVYEVVWSKFLSQMLGSTIYAQTVVLAAFMGGLAVGNWAFGKRSDQLSHPVRAYGCLEIIIGIYALLFFALDRFADRIFVSIGTHIAEK